MSIQIGESKPCPCYSGMLTAEHVREAIFGNSSYASYDGAKYYADGIGMQAIADELNTRAERTCHNMSCRLDESRFHCSECEFGCWVRDVADGRDKLPSYCPNCGAKVEGRDA